MPGVPDMPNMSEGLWGGCVSMPGMRHAGYAGYAGCVLGRLCFDARHGYAGSVLRGSWQEVFVVKRQGVPGAVCELCTRRARE